MDRGWSAVARFHRASSHVARSSAMHATAQSNDVVEGTHAKIRRTVRELAVDDLADVGVQVPVQIDADVHLGQRLPPRAHPPTERLAKDVAQPVLGGCEPLLERALCERRVRMLKDDRGHLLVADVATQVGKRLGVGGRELGVLVQRLARHAMSRPVLALTPFVAIERQGAPTAAEVRRHRVGKRRSDAPESIVLGRHGAFAAATALADAGKVRTLVERGGGHRDVFFWNAGDGGDRARA